MPDLTVRGTITRFASAAALFLCTVNSAHASWRAAGADVERAIKDPNIAAALAAVDAIDAALINDDRAASPQGLLRISQSTILKTVSRFAALQARAMPRD